MFWLEYETSKVRIPPLQMIPCNIIRYYIFGNVSDVECKKVSATKLNIAITKS